ncbi:MAG: spermidine synthase [Candidatus Omnitrophota bacterium]
MKRDGLKLFAISVAMLFLEICLIRWISTEIRIFAYFSNLVLLACFLGIGVGCYYSAKPANLLITAGILLFFVFAVYSPALQNVTAALSHFSDSVIWDQKAMAGSFTPSVYGLTLTLFLFLLIMTAFVPLGQIFGKLMDEHTNIIAAYSVNIAGSLLGIWLFNACSFFFTPPWIWFSLVLFLLAFFLPRRRYVVGGVLLTVTVIVIALSLSEKAPLTVWSPYQKLEIYPNTNRLLENGYVLKVNNTHYMSLSDLSEEFTKRYPAYYPETMVRFNQYMIPYRLAASSENVLVVGSGGGNDVAAALRSGAAAIDAVEIDPGIIKLGRALHPEEPYRNERVRIFVDDARAFFKKSRDRYDVISFGLLDSHTLGSNYNNMRLDHYVYTAESFREVKRLLKEDGVLTVSFAANQPWIGDRLYRTLEETFGTPPLSFTAHYKDLVGTVWGSVMFATGNDAGKIRERLEADPELARFIESTRIEYEGRETVATDDWPYLYLQARRIPMLYLLVGVCILFLIFVTQQMLIDRSAGGLDLHFFFLGAAFLLLEFQNISKGALLWGSTWIANAYIISAILIIILLANALAHFRPGLSVRWLYGLLLGCVVVLYFFPLDALNRFGMFTKSVLSAVLLNLPIFFAGTIFILSLRRTPHKPVALGSNLIGAAVGGVLECLSFVLGIKALLLVVFLFYALSGLFLRASLAPGIRRTGA